MLSPADVYWNSHKRCFSVKPRKPDKLPGFTPSPKGRVFYNRGPFVLEHASFHVSESGRQWVLKNKRKTVHATIRGVPRVPKDFSIPSSARRVKYNPYKNTTFVLDDGLPITGASVVYFKDNEVWII